MAGCSYDELILPGGATSTGTGCGVGLSVAVNGSCNVQCSASSVMKASCESTGVWGSTTPCGSTSSSSTVTSEAWFWVLIVLCLIALLVAVGVMIYFLWFRRKEKPDDDENPEPYKENDRENNNTPPIVNANSPKKGTAKSPAPPAQPKNHNDAATPVMSPRGHPLISALKGSPKPPNRLARLNRKRGVTFSEYHPGDAVTVMYDNLYHAATVLTHDPDGTYTIQWHPLSERLTSTGIASRQMRPTVNPVVAASSFGPDDSSVWSNPSSDGMSYGYDYSDARLSTPVQCLWQNSWHTGTLEAVNPDGSYVIRWVDGTYTPNMDPADTKVY